jgi:hypothetical protein
MANLSQLGLHSKSLDSKKQKQNDTHKKKKNRARDMAQAVASTKH